MFAVVTASGASAESPDFDGGYGGYVGAEVGQKSDQPCFSEGYGSPCVVAGDSVNAGAVDARQLARRLTKIGIANYGSDGDYGSDTGRRLGMQPCVCLPRWTSYQRGPGCGSNIAGCPPVSCDLADDPWCKVANAPCLEEEDSWGGGWAYCQKDNVDETTSKRAESCGSCVEICMSIGIEKCDCMRDQYQCYGVCAQERGEDSHSEFVGRNCAEGDVEDSSYSYGELMADSEVYGSVPDVDEGQLRGTNPLATPSD